MIQTHAQQVGSLDVTCNGRERYLRCCRFNLPLAIFLLTALLIGCSGASTSLEVLTVTQSQSATTGAEVGGFVTPGVSGSVTTVSEEASLSEKPDQSLAKSATTSELPLGKEFPEAPERDLYRLTAELKKIDVKEVDMVVNPGSESHARGRKDTFWLIDGLDLRMYSSLFELRLVSPHAYWYFEEGQNFSQAAIERAADRFEKDIYPRIIAAFGKGWSPRVGKDPRLNILNAQINGMGGYFSSSDQYPVSVNQFSNQRETIYINTAVISVDSPWYLEVLAHEFQHAVHWSTDASEDTWVNEGLSELAITVAGFGQSSIQRFLRSPPTSLIHWPMSTLGSGASYGAASLFIHYLIDHYGDINNVTPLLAEPKDGVNGINAYLESSGYHVTFRDLFRDWLVANVLDEGAGPYSYSNMEVNTRASEVISDFSRFTSKIPQYAVEYVELVAFDEALELQFSAPAETKLLPVEVDARGCWWGNSGDSISATLTRFVDLTGLDQATLIYQVWFEIEENWDYGYLEVSVDAGQTWDILSTPNTTGENPFGNSFGMGYTGESGGWIDEVVELSNYVGQQILLRYQYVTDDSLNGSGICVKGMSIPEAGLVDVLEGWTTQGFVWTDNKIKQEYIVQVIMVADDNHVIRMDLDENNSGSLIIVAPGELEELMVAVAAMAEKTRQEAPYTLTIKPAA